MTNYSTGEAKACVETKASSILNRLALQLSTLEDNVRGVEEMGHRLRNTNFPTEPLGSINKMVDRPDEGFFADLDAYLNRLEGLNKRLAETGKKIVELI
jgi:hypothetical protein